MPKYIPNSISPVQVTSREILKIMYNPPLLEDAFQVSGSKPDGLKVQPPWSADSLADKLKQSQEISLTLVREVLEMLHENGYVVGVPGGYELTEEEGRREAERLGAKPIQRSASG
jgi:hypothetical protein